MKIFSWNINGLRAVLNKGALQDFLATERPDILCLQEIKAKPAQVDYDFPGYQIFWNPAERPGYSGTAILVKDGIVTKEQKQVSSRPLAISGAQSSSALASCSATGDAAGRGPHASLHGEGEAAAGPVAELSSAMEPFSPLAVKEGRIQILDCGHFYLVNVYTPNSKPDLSRLSLREEIWDPGFLQMLQELEKTKPVVTCGDFNAAHTEIDLARPKTNHHSAGFTDEERSGVANLINAGFIDTFRSLHPGVQRYTWWSHWGQARANNVGWRIDYFFISSTLRSHLVSAEIYESRTGSDHCPISIELKDV